MTAITDEVVEYMKDNMYNNCNSVTIILLVWALMLLLGV